MSENVMVSFGLSPYEHVRSQGWDDCSAIASMQIEGGDPLELSDVSHDSRQPASSYLEIELPRDVAENTYDFLRIHDGVLRTLGLETGHTNCHVATGMARGWIAPDSVQPALMQGYKLNPDEVERVRPRDFDDLVPGEVYSFTGKRGRRYGWLHPAHSIMPLPGTDLHFSQLGWGGNPYIGGLRGAITYYSGQDKGMYHVVRKPRDMDDITDWRQRILQHKDVDSGPDEVDEALAKLEEVGKVARRIGRIPAQRSLSLV